MKTKTKRIVTILACASLAMLLLVGLLAGCASKAYDRVEAPEMAYTEADYGNYWTEAETRPAGDYSNLAVQNALDQAGGAGNVSYATTASAEEGRFVIATADISIQTKTYDAFSAALKADLKTMGGYTNAYNEWNYDSDRHASVVARVPSQKLDAFLDSLAANGTVISKNVSSSDVTDEMIETGSRKEALKNEETALLAILEKAKNVEEIITVQDRLSWVRAELQSYSQKLQSLQNQVKYSTVNIDVREVNRITTPTQKFSALASSGFLGSLRDIGSGLRNFALWFIGAIPYLVMLAIPAAVLIWFLHHRRKNKQAKKAKKAASDA